MTIPGPTKIIAKTLFVGCALISLSGCGLFGGDELPDRDTPVMASNTNADQDDDGGFLFFGGDDDAPTGGIGVNSFLWRATLDTLAFMPLQSADPFGGVIISDWYEDPESPGERFKVTVYILDQRLRADGLRVAVFRQETSTQDGWIDAPVSATTALDLENAILTRARQLRIDSIQD